MAGRKGERKPASRRQGRGTADFGLLRPNDALDIAPTPPVGLLKATKDLWTSFWASPVAQIIDLSSDREALEHWIWCVDERARAKRAYRKQRLVEGSMGQPRLNPLAKQIAELTSQIKAAEEAFGLTPQARLRLGIAIGDATRSLSDLLADLDADDDDEPEVVDLDSLEVEGRVTS